MRISSLFQFLSATCLFYAICNLIKLGQQLPLDASNAVKRPRTSSEYNLAAMKIRHSTILTRGTKTRLVVAGAVKDAEEKLPRLHKTIAGIADRYEIVRLVFFENDSVDNTRTILDSWGSHWPLLRISVTNLTLEKRTERLAYGRNALWKAVEEIAFREPIDHVLMIDMDSVNYHLAHLEQCFELPEDWSVCCANQYTIYYDLWALRSKYPYKGTKGSWMDCDWLADCPREVTGDKLARFPHIPADQPPIEVQSCFGGAALYRYSHLKGLNLTTYSGTRVIWRRKRREHQTVPICEHVMFHASLREQRPSLRWYIQPKFLNDGPEMYKFAHREVAKIRRKEWDASHQNPHLSKFYNTRLDS